MDIKPALVKELRERTGAGMMDCKKALVDAKGDLDAAGELLRKQGQAKADKKASRIAAEGRVAIKSDERAGRYALVEVNSETDFVAKDDNFRNFVERVAGVVLAKRPASVEALMSLASDGRTLEEGRLDLGRGAVGIAKYLASIQARRCTPRNCRSAASIAPRLVRSPAFHALLSRCSRPAASCALPAIPRSRT